MSEHITTYFNNIASGVKSFLSGLVLTWDHFKNKKEKVATLQYPHEKFPVPEKNIGFDHSEYNVIRSRLHVDIDDCIGCLQCERACPVDCIKIDTIKPPKGSEYDCGKTSHDTQKKMIVPRFTIDMSECMYCNLCVYPCPEECIYMVGGPNEDKHEIDYEFSQYKREGMIFEFTNVTDQEIVDIGGEDYLKKRKEKEEKITEGERLLGIKEEIVKEEKVEDAPKKKEEESGLSLKVFNNVEDKMARGIAKKAFVGSKRLNMSYTEIAKAVTDALTKTNKMVEGMDKAIDEIANYIDKVEAVDSSPSIDPPSDNAPSSNDSEVKESAPKTDEGLFDIKSLNDIDDRVIRGTLKKVYMAGKKASKNSSDVIDDMKNQLNSDGKLTDELTAFLEGILNG